MAVGVSTVRSGCHYCPENPERRDYIIRMEQEKYQMERAKCSPRFRLMSYTIVVEGIQSGGNVRYGNGPTSVPGYRRPMVECLIYLLRSVERSRPDELHPSVVPVVPLVQRLRGQLDTEVTTRGRTVSQGLLETLASVVGELFVPSEDDDRHPVLVDSRTRSSIGWPCGASTLLDGRSIPLTTPAVGSRRCSTGPG